MANKKLPRIHRIFYLGLIISIFYSFSTSPPLGLTGAPGDNTCFNCHFGGSQVGTVDITGIPDPIFANQTYNVGICITLISGTSTRAGFQFVALDGNSFSSPSAGTISNLGTNVGMGVSGNRTYARHAGEQMYTNGKITYNFDWTAPPTAPDSVSFYATALIGNGSGSSNDAVVFSNIQNIPLPVDLIEFKVTDQKNGSVDINWTTASEVNSDYFELLRSKNGSDFYPIANITAAGNSSQDAFYSFQDENPILNQNSYYRLKQFDFDGAYYFSDIVPIRARKTDDSLLNIFPNPASSTSCLFIDYFSEEDYPNAKCQILNMQGRSAFESPQLNAGIEKGFNKFVLDLVDVPVGQYIFNISNEGEVIENRLVIVSN